MASSDYPAITPKGFVSPLPAGESFYFDSAHTIYPYYHAVTAERNTYYQKITAPDGMTYENEYKYSINGATSGEDVGINLTLLSGTYIVYYAFTYYEQGPLGNSQSHTVTATYTFTVVENRLPLKKWTCTEVINRLLDLAEPIRKGEKARFRLQGMNDDGTKEAGSQAALFDNILSPEFGFTKQTLRECLRQVGEVIHGEPRFTPKKDGAGAWYYELTYDRFGQGERWKHAYRAYVAKDVAQNINTYTTDIDTAVENLVNKSGSITEPYAGGGITPRTEQMYVQITEGNMLIPTLRPIYTVDKIEWLQNAGGTLKAWDITPWLFENSVYNSQLSSYDGQYPYAKAYAIKYTQGEKNITGLTFKAEHPVSSAFNNYAILNILRAATGDDGLTIEQATGSAGAYKEGGYPQLCFRVTYTPMYQARVGQTKINYKEYPTKAAMIYNQQSNVVDSRAYGENLKGVAARFGNAEKSYTYHFSRLSQIPKAGMMFDDDYMISAVNVEILPNIINCTIALTKDFNRISQYVGISSVKRYSQVSQNMAYERNTLWTEYVVIGDAETADADSRIGDTMMAAIADTFTQKGDYPQLTAVYAQGVTGEGGSLPAVCLPVIASSFGNSISFSWEYADNFSAGPVSRYEQGGSGKTSVTGYFQNDYQYTDYYGKIYYYAFDIAPAGPAIGAGNYLSVANGLPGVSGMPSATSGYFSTIGQQPYILRKDNREKLQCNVQIDFVTNRKGFIIGSALAANCGAVRGTDGTRAGKLYIFPERLNKFIGSVQGDMGAALSSFPSMDITVSGVSGGRFTVSAGAFTAGGKSWAIVTAQTTRTVQVETERGTVETQTYTEGGEVLIGQNMDFAAGDKFPAVTFTKKRKIFKEDVWTNIR